MNLRDWRDDLVEKARRAGPMYGKMGGRGKKEVKRGGVLVEKGQGTLNL